MMPGWTGVRESSPLVLAPVMRKRVLLKDVENSFRSLQPEAVRQFCLSLSSMKLACHSRQQGAPSTPSPLWLLTLESYPVGGDFNHFVFRVESDVIR